MSAPSLPQNDAPSNSRYLPKPKGRNLVLTIDGTSNKFGKINTNVVELYSRLAATEEQLNYYNSGVGTFAQPPSMWKKMIQKIDNTVDLAIAWNVEKIIVAAYRWLMERYKPGDHIYLFGFSRGAYQIRVLAAMIEKVGLIQEGNEEQIPFAFELYKSISKEDADVAVRFKETFSMPNVRVHFVGVWDTVSSVGLIGGKTLPLTDKCEHINIFRHALALDERRVKFIPECIMRKNGEDVKIHERKCELGSGVFVERVKEVWFAGSHSDVGGGNLPNDQLNLASAPLLWMVNEAAIAGLLLKQATLDWDIRDLEKTRAHKSLRSIWWFLEYFPVHRQSRSNPNGKSHFSLHRGKGRAIYNGQKIHASVTFKNRKYKPKAVFRPNQEIELKEFIAQGPTGSSVGRWSDFEMDIFDLKAGPRAIKLLSGDLSKDLSDANTLHVLNRLGFLASLDGGVKSILDSEDVKPTLEKSLGRQGLIFLATVKLLARLAAAAPHQVPARDSILDAALMGKDGEGATHLPEAEYVALQANEAQAGAASASQVVLDLLSTNEITTGMPPVSASEARAVPWDSAGIPPPSVPGSDVLHELALWARQAVVSSEVTGRVTAMLQDTGTAMHLDLLKGGDATGKVSDSHKGAAASTIVELARLDEAREGLHACISALVRMLRTHDASGSANALMALAQHGNARKIIYNAIVANNSPQHGINGMFEGLSHRGPSAVVIADLAEYLFKAQDLPVGMTPEQAQDVINRETISLLVKMLVDDADNNCGYAADAIASLCRHAKLRTLITGDDDTIPNLIKMLRVKEHSSSAANALAALVRTEPIDVHDVRQSILDGSRTSNTTKIVSVLVEMLEDNCYEPAAVVLSELVSDRNAAHVILSSKARSSLMYILNKPDKQDKVPAARCIAAIFGTYLATLDVHDANYPAPAFSEVVIDHQGILNLVEMLQEGSNCRAVADAIAALAEYDPKQRNLILESVHVVQKLVDMLQGDQFASAAVSLAQLAVGDHPTANEQFLALNVVPTLERILQRPVEVVPASRRPETDAKTTIESMNLEAEDADQDKGPGVKLEAYDFDKVAGAAAILFNLGGFRLSFKSLDNLVKIFVKHLGAKSQDGVWNAIKELASHDDSKEHVEKSDVVAVSVYLSRAGDRRQRIFATKCLLELAELGIGPRSEQYTGRAMVKFCQRFASTGR